MEDLSALKLIKLRSGCCVLRVHPNNVYCFTKVETIGGVSTQVRLEFDCLNLTAMRLRIEINKYTKEVKQQQ